MAAARLKTFELLANAVRAKEIVTVLVRHGFADLVRQLGTPGTWWRRVLPVRGPRRSPPVRLRLVLEELGPTFIKVGQMLAARPDLLPPDYVAELRHLQDRVAPEPFSTMREVLAGALGGASPEEVFSEFDEKPVASASLAQVYFARLRADNRAVAVKLQRPGLLELIEPDLDLIAWFASQAHQRVAALRPYDLPAVVQEVRSGLLRELDYRYEAGNQSYFNALNRYPEAVFAPEVVSGLTHQHLLVMDRIDGRRLDEARLSTEEACRIARAGATSLLHQVLVEGFFHGDPHGGNLRLTPDGRICFLDWGLAGHLTERMRATLADFFIAAASADAEQLVQLALGLASAGSRPDVRQMEKEVTLALRDNFNAIIGRQEVGRLVFRLLSIFGRSGISFSRDYVLMAKAVATIEETGRALDPSFDLTAVARPVLTELQRKRWGARNALRRTRRFVLGTLGRLQDLPDRLERLVRRVEQDDLTIQFQHKGLEDLDDAINSASSRLTLGVILGSLLIGSSVVMTTKVPPLVGGHPLLGLLGYLFAAMIGLWVVWDIVRHGRHK